MPPFERPAGSSQHRAGSSSGVRPRVEDAPSSDGFDSRRRLDCSVKDLGFGLYELSCRPTRGGLYDLFVQLPHAADASATAAALLETFRSSSSS
eukprot:4742950-Prymnesium_polylepis.1